MYQSLQHRPLLGVLVLSGRHWHCTLGGIGPNVGRAREGSLGQKGSVIMEALPRPPYHYQTLVYVPMEAVQYTEAVQYVQIITTEAFS